MRELELYFCYKYHNGKVKTKVKGYEMTDELAFVHPINEKNGWLVLDIKTGLPLSTFARKTREGAKQYYNERMRHRYFMFKQTPKYQQLIEELQSIKEI